MTKLVGISRALVPVVLAGCTLGLRTGADVPVGDSPRGAAGLPGDPARPGDAARPLQTGTLAVAVEWPVRGPSYRAQVIPESAGSIRVRVLDQTGGTELGFALLVRPSDGPLISTATMDVVVGNDLQVEAKAFKVESPGSDTVPIAAGLKTGVSVAPSTETEVTIKLVPPNPPAISGFSPSNGGPGATIKILGDNFLLGTPVVLFTSQATASVSGPGDTALDVEVPTGSVTGLVSVTTDGLSTTSAAVFKVLKTLALTPAATTGLAAGATVSFSLAGTDTSDVAVPDASAALSFDATPLDGEDAADFEASMAGLAFTPISTGSWLVTARSGSVVATASVSAR